MFSISNKKNNKKENLRTIYTLIYTKDVENIENNTTLNFIAETLIFKEHPN